MERRAPRRGIPSLAVGAGLAQPPSKAPYSIATKQAVAWLTKNRATLPTAKATVTNLNVPLKPKS